MKDIILAAENFVTKLYAEKIDDTFKFHTFKQAQRKVKTAVRIAEGLHISAAQIEVLVLAAWFYDTGFTRVYEKHELLSAEIAREFLADHHYPKQKIEQVVDCILGTGEDRQPTNDLQKILYDANISYIGRKNYFKRIGQLREEVELRLKKKYTDNDWLVRNIDLINRLDFFTDFARDRYGAMRIRNLSALREKLKESEASNVGLSDAPADKPGKIKKMMRPDRGVETMFRVTSRNHFTLSSIADSKASTLISISALIISIIISVLVRRLSEQPELIIPTVLILITLLGTIIFAVLATRPKVTALNLSREDIQKRRGNLLFFGNFIGMSVDDYEWGMQELMNDRKYLYNNLIRDIYYLGLVLGKKYRYLSFAYNFFMYGLILSVVSYIIAFAL